MSAFFYMKNFDYILFDLDGTLTDSAPGVINSVIYALSKFGIEVTDGKELYKFIGPPLWESFKKFYGFSDEDTNKAADYCHEYYSNKGIYENRPFEGLEDLLKLLKTNDKTLIVATAKLEAHAKRILEHFGIAGYFTYIAGANIDGTRVKKDEIIFYALKSCNISDRSKVIMIGDREHDIVGAKKNSIHSIGVLYGYGSKEELEKAGADYIVESVNDIGELLLANESASTLNSGDDRNKKWGD
jgi:phosphoglycolate phosphatase